MKIQPGGHPDFQNRCAIAEIINKLTPDSCCGWKIYVDFDAKVQNENQKEEIPSNLQIY
jgi:hypothetical protein